MDVRQELVELRAEVARQRLEIAALQERAGNSPDANPTEGAPTRRQLLTAAVAAVAGGAAAVSASPAEAADGDPLRLGLVTNQAASPTGTAFTGTIGGFNVALGVTDHGGGFPFTAAVGGHTKGHFRAGVLGYDASAREDTGAVIGLTRNGQGVWGRADGSVGWAVHGHGVTNGARGVYGVSTGATPDSIGVAAEAFAGATALRVDGVVRVSRAGVTVITAGQHTKFVFLNQMTNTSLVFANLQPYTGSRAVAGCRVKTTAPAGFYIKLTDATPVAVRVAWVVIDTTVAPSPTSAAGDTRSAPDPFEAKRKALEGVR